MEFCPISRGFSNPKVFLIVIQGEALHISQSYSMKQIKSFPPELWPQTWPSWLDQQLHQEEQRPLQFQPKSSQDLRKIWTAKKCKLKDDNIESGNNLNATTVSQFIKK